MINQAFELISKKVETTLATQGFEKVGVTNKDSSEIVSLFTSEDLAYSVVYYVRKKHMVLESCGMTEEGPDNEWKTLATWMFDPNQDTIKEAESIGNDFVSVLAEPQKVKTIKNVKKKKKDDEGNADPLFLAKRFLNLFPEIKDEIKNEEDCYYPFRGVTFAKASIVPKVNALLETGTKDEIKKLATILNAQYDAGDKDTRAIITIVVLNGIEKEESVLKLQEEMSDSLKKAFKPARKYKGKKVKPEKKKAPKITMAERLSQQQR